MEGNYLSPIIDAFKPILIFAVVLWGAETIITMLIKDHKKAKRKQAREKRRLEYQDRRMAKRKGSAKWKKRRSVPIISGCILSSGLFRKGLA